MLRHLRLSAELPLSILGQCPNRRCGLKLKRTHASPWFECRSGEAPACGSVMAGDQASGEPRDRRAPGDSLPSLFLPAAPPRKGSPGAGLHLTLRFRYMFLRHISNSRVVSATAFKSAIEHLGRGGRD
jgi:hypothetical protein